MKVLLEIREMVKQPVLPTVSLAELDAVPYSRHDVIAEIVRRHKGKVIVE